MFCIDFNVKLNDGDNSRTPNLQLDSEMKPTGIKNKVLVVFCCVFFLLNLVILPNPDDGHVGDIGKANQL